MLLRLESELGLASLCVKFVAASESACEINCFLCQRQRLNREFHLLGCVALTSLDLLF